MNNSQDSLLPTVVKLCHNSYAVITDSTTSSQMRYIYVMLVKKNDDSLTIKCMASECKKKYGRSKQVLKLNNKIFFGGGNALKIQKSRGVPYHISVDILFKS